MKIIIRTLASLAFLISLTSVAFAESKIIADEVELLKAKLPIEQNGLKLTDVKYISREALYYRYELKSAGKKIDELKSSIEKTKSKTIDNLCKAVPAYLQNELMKEGAPMIYNFYSEANTLVDFIVIDFSKCKSRVR